MKRIKALPCLLLLFCAATEATSGQQKVKTPVEKVTVFIDGAQVTRTQQIDLPAGSSKLVFTGLSPYLDEKSLQVSAKGKFTVTAVNRLFNYTDSMERTTQQQTLEQKIVKIEQQQKKLKAAREVITAENELLKVNCSVGNRNTATSIAAIKELNDYYSARLQALKEKSLSLEEQEMRLVDKEHQLREELAQLGGKQSAPMSEIEVRIEAPATCKATFALIYYVRNAGWFPSYDVRSGGLTEPAQISYKANIIQNTKEEWKDVTLTLSSSNPNTGSIAPQLKTYWLDYGLAAPRYTLSRTSNTISGIVFDSQREPLVGATVLVPRTTLGTSTDAQGQYSLTVPDGTQELQFAYIGYIPQTKPITGNSINATLQEDAQSMEEAVVVAYGLSGRVAGLSASAPKYRQAVNAESTVDERASAVMEVEQTQNQLGYEFEIKRPYTVQSDGKIVVAEIGRFDLPAVYSYQSTPKIDKDAFLIAEVTDWEQFSLLQGEASVYFENTFVGKSILSPGEANDTLRFSLGRDSGIRIERTKQNDYKSRRTIGSNQTQTTGWTIDVRNTRAESISLTLYDQLPVSRNSTITVTEEELSGAQLDKSNGTVTWKLTLKPGEQRKLLLKYCVKYPKGQYLTIE